MTTSSANELKQKGNEHFSSGDYKTAIDYFSQAIAQDGNNHVLFSNRSACYAALKEYQNALKDAEESVKLMPKWAKGYGRKGAALFGLGSLEEAEKAYEEGLKIEPENQALKKGLEQVQAEFASKSGNFQNPLNALNNLFSGPEVFMKLQKNPKTSAFMSQPDFLQTLSELQRNPSALGQHIQDPRIMQAMGVLMGVDIMTGDEAAKQKGWDREPVVQKEEPTVQEVKTDKVPEPEVKMEEDTPVTEEEQEEQKAKQEAQKEKEMGNQFYKQKKFDQALQHYEKAFELNDQDVTILTNQAAVYFEMNQFDKCIEYCQQAIEKGRELRVDYKILAKAYARLGNAYTKQENFPLAVQAYQKSLTEHRTADVLDKLKQVEKKLEEIKRKEYQDPEKAEQHRQLGNDLFKKGDYASALKEYTESIKRAENDARGYSNRSACYSKLMALPEALKDAEKAIELDPTFVKAYLRKASLLHTMKEYLKAIQCCDEALQQDEQHHQQKYHQEIEQQKQKSQLALYGYGTDNDQNISREEKMKQAMNDPKVQEILSDPVMRTILEQMTQDPGAAREHLKNPQIMEKIQILAAAGVIGMK